LQVLAFVSPSKSNSAYQSIYSSLITHQQICSFDKILSEINLTENFSNYYNKHSLKITIPQCGDFNIFPHHFFMQKFRQISVLKQNTIKMLFQNH